MSAFHSVDGFPGTRVGIEFSSHEAAILTKFELSFVLKLLEEVGTLYDVCVEIVKQN